MDSGKQKNLLKRNSFQLFLKDIQQNVDKTNQLIEQLLYFEDSLDSYDEEGCTLLHAAVKIHFNEIVNVLIRAGASVHVKTIKETQHDALEYAFIYDNLGAYKSLIAEGATLSNGQKQVFYAAQQGSLKILKHFFCLNQNCIHVANSANQTPLIYASIYGQRNIVLFLLEHGASLDNVTLLEDENDSEYEQHGMSAFHYAIVMGHLDLCKILIDACVDLSSIARYKNMGYNPLHIAVFEGHLHIVNFLLLLNPDWLNGLDLKQNTPLFYAVDRGYLDIVVLLHQNGAILFVPEWSHPFKTILEWAVIKGHLAIVNYLLNHQSEVNLNHLFHLAVANDQPKIMSYFLRLDFNLWEQVNQNGKLAIQVAQEKNHQNTMVKLQNLQDWSNAEDKEHFIKSMFDKRYYEEADLLLTMYARGRNLDFMTRLFSTDDEISDFLSFMPWSSHLLLNNANTLSKLCENPDIDVLGNPTVSNSETFSDEPETNPDIKLYQKSTSNRRNSIYMEYNQSLKQWLCFHKDYDLGKGAYGVVSKFINPETGNVKAVKYPLPLVCRKNSDVVSAARHEEESRQLYKPKSSSLFRFFSENSDVGTLRLVMPFEGVTLYNYTKSLVFFEEWIQIILLVTEELIKFHEVGRIHSDIKANNILIEIEQGHKLKVNLIDFGASQVFGREYYTPGELSHIPPECRRKIQKAHTNQDVYYFCSMFNFLLNSSSVNNKLFEHAPYIYEFIKRGLDEEPSNRPNLRPLYHSLYLSYEECKTRKNESWDGEITMSI